MSLYSLKVIEIVIPIILGVAYFTLAERKVMGSMQRRKGPNVIGFYGLLQPIVDGVKLILKETILPRRVEFWLYLFAPSLTLLLSILIWLVLPFSLHATLVNFDLGLLYILAISTLSIYGVLYGGWVSQSKYAILGALRATAQLISYEVSIGIIIMSFVLVNGSFDLVQILLKQALYTNVFFLAAPLSLLLISFLAETNRTPFDLLEAESELVAGFLVEYSSLVFAAFYLGEYCFIYNISAILALLGFGSYPASLATLAFVFLFIWIRATLPRLRYDQLMYLGWNSILPLALSLLIFYYSACFLFHLI